MNDLRHAPPPDARHPAEERMLDAALLRPLRGTDDLTTLADAPVCDGCELTVLDLLKALTRTMPRVACSWVVSAATVSRTCVGSDSNRGLPLLLC